MDVIAYSLVDRYRHRGGPCCIYIWVEMEVEDCCKTLLPIYRVGGSVFQETYCCDYVKFYVELPSTVTETYTQVPYLDW